MLIQMQCEFFPTALFTAKLAKDDKNDGKMLAKNSRFFANPELHF
jgi:hypothetical protein